MKPSYFLRPRCAIVLSLAIAPAFASAPHVAWAMSPSGQGEATWSVAPDGERGFGERRTLRDLAHLLRSTAEEDKALVASLYKLEPDLHVLLALVRDRYHEQGYFALLGPGAELALEAQIETLGKVFREHAVKAAQELARGTQADLLAHMLADARMRARAGVIEGLEFELSELKGGLALLFAQLDGFVDLKEPEAEALARRVDLAAARLRAMRLDLEALRESRETLAADAASNDDVGRLLALAHSTDEAQRDKELGEMLARLDQRELQMSATLFTTRQSEKIDSLLARRSAAMESAERMLPQVRELMPDTPEGAKPGPDIKALPKSRRYAYAARTAVEALEFDSLNEELNYLAAVSSDFLYGAIESRRWFDRFLALRGIRAHDNRTYQTRRLSREEKRALEAVQAESVQPTKK